MRVCVCVRCSSPATPFFPLSNNEIPVAVPRTPTGRVGTAPAPPRRPSGVAWSGGLFGRRGGPPPVTMAPAVAPRAWRRPRPSWSLPARLWDHCPVLRRGPVHVGAALHTEGPRRPNPFGRPPRIDSTAPGPRIGPHFPAPRRRGFEPGPAVCRSTGQKHAHPSPGPCDGSSALKAESVAHVSC